MALDNRFKKLIAIGVGAIPVITLIANIALWVDTRYMHKEISDTRHIDLQINITEGHVRDYERMVDKGITPSPTDTREYELGKTVLSNLFEERNRLLGIGGE